MNKQFFIITLLISATINCSSVTDVVMPSAPDVLVVTEESVTVDAEGNTLVVAKEDVVITGSEVKKDESVVTEKTADLFNPAFIEACQKDEKCSAALLELIRQFQESLLVNNDAATVEESSAPVVVPAEVTEADTATVEADKASDKAEEAK